MITCPSCGTQNEADAEFCVKCGTPLSAETAPPASSPEAAPRPVPPPAAPGPQVPYPPSAPGYGAPPGPAPIGYAPQPGYQPGYPPYPVYAPRPPKDRSIAFILEILPGLFGLLGFGWIYSGNTATGFVLLVGYLFWNFIVILAAVLSGGFACFCTVPMNLVAVSVSALFLNQYTKQHRELFG